MINKIRPLKLIDDTLVRLGNPMGDGGYACPKSVIFNSDILYSYGVGDNSSFENNYTELTGKAAHMYDYTVNCTPVYKNHIFHKEGLSGNPTSNCNNFLYHLQQNGDNDKKVLLKIDIEGAEYEWINNTDMKEVSTHVDGLIIEFHNCTNEVAGSFDRIMEHYNVVHWHHNNFGGTYNNFPLVPEVTFLNKSIAVGDYVSTLYPIVGLDIPNNGSAETFYHKYS